MPTTRHRKTRGPIHPLTKPEKHLLLTGECCPPKGTWADQGELKFRTFTLVSPAGRSELKALWELNRTEIMAGWKGKGFPWAAKEFDHEAPENRGF